MSIDATSSSARLLYAKETLFGEVIPATNPMTQLNFTKENLATKNTTIDSNTIRSDGAVADQYLVGQEVTGSFSSELTGSAFDDFIQSACRGTFDGTTGLLSSGIVATPSFRFEKGFLDITQFLSLRGCSLSDLAITIASRAAVLADFTFMGTAGAIYQASKASAIAGPSNNTSFTSGTGVSAIKVNGAAIGVGVKQIKLDIKNNLRAREVVDSLYSRQHGRGDLDITATLDLYFSNASLYQYYLANTSLALSFTISDNVGFAYDITLPRLKPKDDNAGQISGKNTDIMEQFQVRALYDPVTNCQIQVTRRTF